MAIIVPICGIRGCMSRYLSSVVGRAFSYFRYVVVSSYSPSGDVHLVRRGLTKCGKGVDFEVIEGREGRKISTTEGGKVRLSQNNCLFFVSSSSVLCRGYLRGL